MINIDSLNKENLSKIKTKLDNSGIIIFPTETVWGIGCKFDDIKAVEKLYRIKGRDFSNPLQIQLSNTNQIEEYTSEPIDMNLMKILNTFLPGPLSIVLKKRNVPDFITSNLNTVSIRVSSCDIVTKLIDFLGYPIASTSCNKSGEPVIEKIDEIEKFASDNCDIFISSDCISLNVSSTIISYENGSIKLLREGGLSFDKIKSVIKI